MKKVLSIFTLILSALSGSSQNCSDVFISELVEGWSNNKAVEIFNPTPNPINISEYGLVRFANGSVDYGEISFLNGVTIEPYDVFVVVLEKLDSLGEELEAPVWEELQAVADTFMNPNYDKGIWPMYFNGDDAVALVTADGEVLVDLFGRIGEGAEFGGWGPYLDSEGVQLYISKDHTLKRKPGVMQGQTTNPSEFEILEQWDSLPANTFDSLGFHQCQCMPVNITERNSSHFTSIYPNPLYGNAASIVASRVISDIIVYSETGSLIQKYSQINDLMYVMKIDHNYTGTMIVEIHFADGVVERQRIIH